jgi:hypothetical protein
MHQALARRDQLDLPGLSKMAGPMRPGVPHSNPQNPLQDIEMVKGLRGG